MGLPRDLPEDRCLHGLAGELLQAVPGQGGRAIYIRSYNGTSVGIMQINERVWRGLYDERNLRWDISYNARAGAEILGLYFSRYALKEIKSGTVQGTLPADTLARAVYAMYNGGPGQFREFLKRDRKKAYFLSDKLFFEKYRWVREDAWNNIRQCLIGG